MSDFKKSLYVGNAKEIKLKDNATGMSVTINLNDLWEKMKDPDADPAKFTSNAGNKYIRLSIFPLKPKSVEEGKRTHSVKIDTWQPEPKKEQPTQQINDNDLPF